MTKEKYEKGEKREMPKKETWEALKDEGNKFYSHKKYEQALKSYSKAIQKASRNDVLFTNKALCFIKLKRFDEACSEAREAIAIAPNSVKGHYLLGQSLVHLERYDDAVIALQTAQKYALEQHKNFGEEIAQSLRNAKSKRWQSREQKRISQELELESYMMSLISLDKEKQTAEVDQADEEYAEKIKKIDSKIRSRRDEVKALFAQIDERRKMREVPDYLCDKISFDLLKNPVITPSGITYNKKDIEEHLQKVGHFDPVSSRKLTSDMLVPNLVMKEVVSTFLEENEWAEDY